MFFLYDMDWTILAGPFDSRDEAFGYAVDNGIWPHKIDTA